MPSFGVNSRKHRDTCDSELIAILDEAIQHTDFSVIWGHRDKESQDKAFAMGNSQLKWPKSKHNHLPARAFDVIPYPGGFSAPLEEFDKLATHILAAASKLKVPLKWGGHWTRFDDRAHYELMED